MKKEISTVTIECSEWGALHAKVTELETLVKFYESQLLSAKRRQFGSTSERTEIDQQLNLFEEEKAAPPHPEMEEIKYKRKKQKGKREEDLSGLPVEPSFSHQSPT